MSIEIFSFIYESVGLLEWNGSTIKQFQDNGGLDLLIVGVITF